MLFGRLGVDLFFAISGFVISRSFVGPPEGSSRRFVIRRVCRLYPAFWVSMLTGMLIWWLDEHPLTLPLLAANATMAPLAFGQPMLIGLYWTLQIELAFYGLCLLLHRFHRLESRATLAACALALCGMRRTLVIVGHLFKQDFYQTGEFGVWMVSLAIMFWGAFFRSVYEETGGFRRAPWRCRGTWYVLLLALAMVDLHDPRLKTFLFSHPLRDCWERLVTLNALAIFALWVAVLRVETRLLTYLGVISYSLYLFHPLILTLFTTSWQTLDPGSRPALPLWLYLVLGVLLTTALATGLYRWVEHPAIAFGKRWAQRGRPARE